MVHNNFFWGIFRYNHPFYSTIITFYKCRNLIVRLQQAMVYFRRNSTPTTVKGLRHGGVEKYCSTYAIINIIYYVLLQ